jgi:hypothetical protein
MTAVHEEHAMRYEPAMNEPAAPRAIRPDIITLPWRASAPRVGDGGEARSRQSAELDIWEDEGGTTSGRAPRYSGRQVDDR